MAFQCDPIAIADFLRRSAKGLREAQERYNREQQAAPEREAANKTS